jgi:hypothetical protein
MLESVFRNVRLTLRHLQRHPAFAATVIVTLGLAIGASTAIFSYVNALLLRPFPFHAPSPSAVRSSPNSQSPRSVSATTVRS